MKILLDENLPKKLKIEFQQHEIWTTREKGWNGKKNGELLRLMQEHGIEVLLTFDKNLQHQQNFSKYPIVVVVLNAFSNDYAELQPLMPKVLSFLDTSPQAGAITIS